jgi:hypothetical protein
MQLDTIKTVFAYAIALLVLAGGGVFLLITRLDPEPSQLLQGAIIGFMGMAVNFVFGEQTATRATRAAAAATAAAQTPPPTA